VYPPPPVATVLLARIVVTALLFVTVRKVWTAALSLFAPA
jgi:hypothetical protein